MVSPWTLLIHLAWLPLLLIAFLKLYRGPHPWPAAMLAYFLGSFMVLPAFGMQQVWNWSVPRSDLVTLLEMPIWFVPVEEGAKVFAALLAARTLGYSPPRRSFFPLALAAALGFAATETALAVTEWGIEVLPLRVLVAIPAHVVFTAFAGAGLVGASEGPVRLLAFLGWWTLASLAHSAYNFVVLYQPDATGLHLLGWLGCLVGATGLLAAVRLMHARQAALPTRSGPPKGGGGAS